MEAYSAGLMSQSFWFTEFKKVVKLILAGNTQRNVKTLCVTDNLFGVSNAYRAARIAGYLTNRAAALDAKEMQLLLESDLATQKPLNLIAILRTDRLFFEFLFEVYREKVMLGIPIMEDRDANIFFNNKAAQNSLIDGWRETTKSHLRQCYFNFMTEANLLVLDGKTRKITPPILDIALERYLETKDNGIMIKAITGVN